jgi:6-phospho-beta-glucosidase
MKITVIGGGSTYTPELVSGFLARTATLPLSELCLMDIDEERLSIVGGFARRMIEAKGSPFALTLSTERRLAISGASYIVSQLRVGKMAARRGDEYLGHRHGLVGQETTGVGGMANALRTIPVVLDIAVDMAELAPGALLLNFANPAGMVTEALFRHAPDVHAVGVCNVGITAKMDFLGAWERLTGEKVDPSRARLLTLGLNHLTWHRGFLVDGRDTWDRLFPALCREVAAEAEPEWDGSTLETLGMMPNYYLQYYYYASRKIAAQSTWPPSRAEEVMAIERELLPRYADPSLTELPSELMKRGGAWYSELATRVVDDHWNDSGGVHVLNTRNAGAVGSWPSDWVLELPASVDRKGIHPLPTHALSGAPAALVTQVKTYELLAVEAAVSGDRRAAREALLAHPLGPEADHVGPLLDDLLALNREWLPRFA